MKLTISASFRRELACSAAVAAALLLGGGLLAPAAAQDNPRDLSGLWDTTQGMIFDPASTEPPGTNVAGPNTRERPPYNAEWEAKYKVVLDEHAKGDDHVVDPLNFCQPAGMPRVLGGMPGPIEIIQTPTMAYFIWEYMSEIHRVYMDADLPKPDDRLEGVMGQAVGHWEGNTLVVETVSMKAGGFDRSGAPHSDQVKTTERIRKIDNATIENDITVEDPLAFTKPWKVKRRWIRSEPGNRIGDLYCDSDRNPVVDGAVQVVLNAPVTVPGTVEHAARARAAQQEAATAKGKKKPTVKK